jgi:hypothetical protein
VLKKRKTRDALAATVAEKRKVEKAAARTRGCRVQAKVDSARMVSPRCWANCALSGMRAVTCPGWMDVQRTYQTMQ